MGRIDLQKAFVFFLLCFFWGTLCIAGTRSLCETLEAESALIAKAYVQGQALLINNLAGNEDLDKPPLYYWLIAAFSYFSPNWEMAARLPSIFAVCLLLAIFYKVSALTGKPRAFFASWSLVFLFCPKVLWMSQIARMDLLFSAICFSSLFFFIRAVGFMSRPNKTRETPAVDRRYLGPFFLCAAISVMIKGPLGAAMVFLPVAVFLVIEKRLRLLRELFVSPYFLLFLAACLPWYVYATLKTDFRFFHRFILEENLSRFTGLFSNGGFKEFNHSPATRYFVYFAVGFFPWSLVAPWWLFHAVKKWRGLAPVSRLFFVYFAFVFLFFSLAQAKRSDYILPLYPAAAFLTAEFLSEKNATWLDLKRFFYFVGALTIITSGLAAILGIMGHLFDLASFISAHFVSESEQAAAFVVNVMKDQVLLYVILFFSASLLLKKQKDIPLNIDEGQSLPPFLVLAGLTVLVISSFVLPAIYMGKDARPFCREVERIAAGSPLYFAGFWDEECAFYIKRKIPRVDIEKAYGLIGNGNKRVFLILNQKKYRRLLQGSASFPYVYRNKGLVFRFLVLVSNLPQGLQKDPAR